MAEEGQLKLIGVPQFATDFEAVDIPDEIQEEIIAINSIYGDGTWKIETTYIENGSSKIRTRLRPPAQDGSSFEDGVSLNIVLPSTYPHQRPEFKAVDKWSKLPQRQRNICVLIFAAIHQLFETGNVCMYEILEYVADRINLLDDSGMLDTSRSRGIATGLVDELQWTLWNDLDVSNIATETACTVCMDEGLAFQMAPLPCGCHYCMTCFTGRPSPGAPCAPSKFSRLIDELDSRLGCCFQRARTLHLLPRTSPREPDRIPYPPQSKRHEALHPDAPRPGHSPSLFLQLLSELR